MKVTLKELHSQLGIDRVLDAYAADSHQVYDEESEKTCSAEVRMGLDQDLLEIEVQLFLDVPKEGELPMQQIMSMTAAPKTDGLWSPKTFIIKGDDMVGKISDWEKSACAFYNALTLELKRGDMPDIDKLIDEHLQGEGGRAGRGKRGGGRKNPKFKPPSNTMKIKQGM